MTTLDEMQDALGEVIPALMAAGMSRSDIRRISDITLSRMGEGGSITEWLTAMTDAAEEVGGKTASRMVKIAAFRFYSERTNGD